MDTYDGPVNPLPSGQFDPRTGRWVHKRIVALLQEANDLRATCGAAGIDRRRLLPRTLDDVIDLVGSLLEPDDADDDETVFGGFVEGGDRVLRSCCAGGVDLVGAYVRDRLVADASIIGRRAILLRDLLPDYEAFLQGRGAPLDVRTHRDFARRLNAHGVETRSYANRTVVVGHRPRRPGDRARPPGARAACAGHLCAR